MKRRQVLAAALGLSMIAALGSACKGANDPADPVWGKEPCAHCAMLVSDRRYAAQAVDDGDHFYFDDIGCMVLWLEGRARARSWVRGDGGTTWVDAGRARYGSGAATPMDFGFEPQADGAVAWDELRSAVLRKNGGSQR